MRLGEAKPGWHGKRLTAGLLKQGESEWALPPLDDARVTKIDARGLLIIGMEQVKGYDNRFISFRQAWWCITGVSPLSP